MLFILVFKYMASVLIENPSKTANLVLSLLPLSTEKSSLFSTAPSNYTIAPGSSQLVRIPVQGSSDLAAEKLKGVISFSAIQQEDGQKDQPMFLNGKRIETVDISPEKEDVDNKDNNLRYVKLDATSQSQSQSRSFYNSNVNKRIV